MLLIGLIAIQMIVSIAGFALLWRRLDATHAELAQLRKRSGARARREEDEPDSAFAQLRRRLMPEGVLRAPGLLPLAESAPAAPAPSFSPEAARGLAVAAALIAPALGFAFGAPLFGVVAAGLCVATGALLFSLRALWRHTAWYAVLGVAAWSIAGLCGQIGAAHAGAFSLALAAASAAGLSHARAQRPAAPGASFAAIAALTTLVIGAQFGLIGPAGVACASTIALAAAIGASTLRLEPMHLAAFAGAGVGLYVLSGQRGADIWFTPAAAWAGVWFLAIAFVRTPLLGARGALIAATGAIAPLFAVSALYAAQHGLETPYAAAAGFAALAAALGATLAVAAHRQGSLAALHLTLWTLALPAAASLAIAGVILLAPPYQPLPLAALALSAVLVDRRWSDRVWRFITATLTLAATSTAIVLALGLDAPSSPWAPLDLALLTLAAPAALLGCAGVLARKRAPLTANLCEGAAIVGGVGALSALTRIAFTGGAPALATPGFVEIGAHAALSITLALALAWGATRAARWMRDAAAAILVGAGLLACIGALAAWLTPGVSESFRTANALHPPLGFAAPALALWANWIYWRRTEAGARQARFFFAAATVLTAAWGTLELALDAALGAAPTVALSAAIFALAVGLNFIPRLPAQRSAAPVEPAPIIVAETESPAPAAKRRKREAVES